MWIWICMWATSLFGYVFLSQNEQQNKWWKREGGLNSFSMHCPSLERQSWLFFHRRFLTFNNIFFPTLSLCVLRVLCFPDTTSSFQAISWLWQLSILDFLNHTRESSTAPDPTPPQPCPPPPPSVRRSTLLSWFLCKQTSGGWDRSRHEETTLSGFNEEPLCSFVSILIYSR